MSERDKGSEITQANIDGYKFTIRSTLYTFLASLGVDALFLSSDYKSERYTPKYRTVEPFQVNGSRVSLIGVNHDVRTFLANREDLGVKIAGAHFVVLEYFNRSIQKLTNPEIFDQNIDKLTSLNGLSDGFFGAVGMICREQEKDVYVVNPENWIIQTMDLFLLLGLPAELILTDLSNAVKRVMRKRVSRRNLLRLAGYGSSALVWGSWYDALNHASITTDGYNEPLPVTSFRWNEVDFRDIKTALAIKKIIDKHSKEIPSHQSILVIQGSVHADGVYKYLNDPNLGSLKQNLYPHYQIAAEPVYRYHYNGKNWEVVEKITQT